MILSIVYIKTEQLNLSSYWVPMFRSKINLVKEGKIITLYHTSKKWKKQYYRREQRKRRYHELNDLLDECYGIIIAKSVIKISKEKCRGCEI